MTRDEANRLSKLTDEINSLTNSVNAGVEDYKELEDNLQDLVRAWDFSAALRVYSQIGGVLHRLAWHYDELVIAKMKRAAAVREIDGLERRESDV